MSVAHFVVFASLAYSTASGIRAMAGEPHRYTFTSGDHIITMDVGFSQPYEGTRLAFYDDTSHKEVCLVGNGESGACPVHFVGTVATVAFTIKRAGGKLRGKASIREYVTVTAQSPDPVSYTHLTLPTTPYV